MDAVDKITYLAIWIGLGTAFYLLLKPNPARWHRFVPIPFRLYKTVTGEHQPKGAGTMFRRWNGSGWDYKFEPETEDEYWDRQW